MDHRHFLLLLALRVPAACVSGLSLPKSSGCLTNLDCSLGGECEEGICKCSWLWQGAQCEQLALGEAAMGSNGYRPTNGASWGGSAIRADDGSYHLFVSFMSRDCGLNDWKFNSVLHHAVSDYPDGPYDFKEEVLPAFAHNPTITRAPDGTYLLFHIGQPISHKEVPLYVKDCTDDNPAKPKRAGNKTDPDEFDGRIRIASSQSLDGPWELLNDGEPILMPRHGFHWDTAVTNPAPLVLPNGSVLLYYRGDDRYHPLFTGERHRKIGVAYADTWRGPYRRLLDEPVTKELGEDPVVFANLDGSGFHMIYENKFQGKVGQHAFSPDGLRWTSIDDPPAYDLLVQWDTGSSIKFHRRERPQFLRDEHGQPLYLFNAVSGGRYRNKRSRDESTWTLATPVGLGSRGPPLYVAQTEAATA